MVLYTGLWNHPLCSPPNDDDDNNDCIHHDQNNTNNKTNGYDPNATLRRSNYGSFLANSKNNNDNDDETNNLNRNVSWKPRHGLVVDIETGNPELPTHYDELEEEDDASMTIGTVSTLGQEQELPGLTAAFSSMENRPILMYCIWYLVIYLGVAVIAYSFTLEHWTIIDSLYFAVATFTTCGYGDKEPTTAPGQIFTIFFAIYGVIILGVFIGIFGNVISQTQAVAKKRFQRQKTSQILKTLFPASIRQQKPTDGSDDSDNDDNDSHGNNDSDAKPKTITTTTMTATEPRKQPNTNHSGKKSPPPPPPPPPVEETGFWQDHISLADDIWGVVQSEFLTIALVATLAAILGLREHWGVIPTIYFSIMAATTTGYGDYTPATQIDKLYCVFFLPLAVAVFGEVLGKIATVYIQRQQRLAERKFLHRSLTLCDLRKMDTNDDGAVDREDFVTFMLVALQKVDKATIDELQSIFDSLDRNGNGTLEEEDLVELAEEHYVPALKRVREYEAEEQQRQEQLQLQELLQRRRRASLLSPSASRWIDMMSFRGVGASSSNNSSTLSPVNEEGKKAQHRRVHTVW